jgi:hypothetical protein
MIKVITATGADDSVQDIDEMLKISTEYPQVEWGILLSKNNTGSHRFPSVPWLQSLATMQRNHPGVLNLSAHLCGRWVRDVFIEGKAEFFDVVPMDIFKRVQFNFHAQRHMVNDGIAVELLKSKFQPYEMIFQFDGVNDELIRVCTDAGLKAYPLFDQSGGAGILPDSWPQAKGYSGYAGGLSPENVAYEIMQMRQSCNGNDIWIDAETKLRTENDAVFDLDRVRDYIKNAQPYMG